MKRLTMLFSLSAVIIAAPQVSTYNESKTGSMSSRSSLVRA